MGFLEADTALHRCAQHLGGKQLADTRVLIVVEIAAAGCRAACVFLMDVLLVEFEEGASVNEI